MYLCLYVLPPQPEEQPNPLFRHLWAVHIVTSSMACGTCTDNMHCLIDPYCCSCSLRSSPARCSGTC
jgi:hypothetical protein